MPMKRSGWVTVAAKSVIGREDVLVDKIVSCGTILSNSSKIDFFISNFSTAASIINWHSAASFLLSES